MYSSKLILRTKTLDFVHVQRRKRIFWPHQSVFFVFFGVSSNGGGCGVEGEARREKQILRGENGQKGVFETIIDFISGACIVR